MPLLADKDPVVGRRRWLVGLGSQPGRSGTLRKSICFHLIEVVDRSTHLDWFPTHNTTASVDPARGGIMNSVGRGCAQLAARRWLDTAGQHFGAGRRKPVQTAQRRTGLIVDSCKRQHALQDRAEAE